MYTRPCGAVGLPQKYHVYFCLMKVRNLTGFDAEDQYEDLFNNDEHDKWYYFKGFKMKLYSAVENDEVCII